MRPRPATTPFASTGRGRNYTRLRGLGEAAMRLCYHRSWPARVWALVPGVTRVRINGPTARAVATQVHPSPHDCPLQSGSVQSARVSPSLSI